MYCCNITCPPGNDHNGLMGTVTLGHNHTWLRNAGIEENKECSSYLKRNENRKYRRRIQAQFILRVLKNVR